MDNENLLSTPSGYATPEQLKSTYDYAKALMQGNLQQPVHHWTQGVSNMVSALVGGNMEYNANRQENAALAHDASGMLPTIPGPKPPFSAGPSSAGQKTADDSTGNASKAIAGIESGGDYNALGPVTKTGDRAYGKYQVMGSNIPEWTKATLGKEMSPEEFLANPQAQETVFKNKFGEYTQKYGPEGASKAWFAGEGGMNDPNRKDQLGTSVADYGKKFQTAFAGPDSQPPAVQAMGAALRGDDSPAPTEVASKKMVTPPSGAMVMPSGGAHPLIDPDKIQRRPQYTDDQMRTILSSPRLSEQAKMLFLQQYQQQNQPITMDYPGGKVIIDPSNPSSQQFIPDLQKGETTLGDLKHPSYGTVIPGQGGGVQFAPAQTAPVPVAPGPQSSAAPVAPAVAPGGPPAPGGTPAPVTAQNAPMPPAAPTKPVQVASLDPAAGVAAAAAPGPTTQPISKAEPTPLAKFAQAGPPPGVSPEALKLNGFSPQEIQDYTAKKAYDNKVLLDQDAAKKAQDNALDLAQHGAINKQDIDKEAQTKSIDFAAKKYDTLSAQGQAARKQMPNLDLALALMSDPNFHGGLASGAQDIWARLKSATGIEPLANAPNEAFDKIISSTVLGGIKDVGGGQIRNAEIQLLGKANANRTNTDASNRAVLEVSRRALQTTDHLDQIGQQYASGDEVNDPIDGKVLLKANIGPDGEITPRHGLDVGYDKLARKFVLEHPSFTPDEIKHYSTIFETGKDPNEPKAAAAPGAPAQSFPPPPKEAIDLLKANPDDVHRKSFEKYFGPADQYLK